MSRPRLQYLLGAGEALGNAVGRGAAGVVAGGHRRGGGDGVHVIAEVGRVFPVLRQRQIGKRRALGLAMLAQPAHDAVGFPEGHALAHQVVRHVGRQHVALAGQRLDALGVQGHPRQHIGEHTQGGQDCIHRVEEPLLVFLQVAVVGERQPFEHGEDSHEAPVHAARLASGDLGEVGVALLGHNAAAGGELVGQTHEIELPAGPDYDLLRQPRHVHDANRSRRMELGQEVAVGHSVHAVGADLAEPQGLGDGVSVCRIRHAGQRPAAQGQHVHAGRAVGEPPDVPLEHLEIGQHVMREQHRLCALQVGVARHHHVSMSLG